MMTAANVMVTALGFFVTLYATLITLFGLAWVLCLIGESHDGVFFLVSRIAVN